MASAGVRVRDPRAQTEREQVLRDLQARSSAVPVEKPRHVCEVLTTCLGSKSPQSSSVALTTTPVSDGDMVTANEPGKQPSLWNKARDATKKDPKMDVATLVQRHQAVSKGKSTSGGDYLADAKAQLALLNDSKKRQVLTPLHLTLELDSGAGPLVETFTASYMAPGQSFSVLGSLHIFENAIAFHGTSAVLGTSTWKIELSKINQLRQISVMGLELTYAETAVSPKTILKLQLIPSRDAVYKMLCKRASLKEYSPGEARKKGRLATKAELEAAMHGNKKSWSSFIFGFFTSHKLPVPQLAVTMVDTETHKVLFVKVHRGKGLAAMDDGASSDPYAEITIGNHSCKTKVIQETCDPEWEEVFYFPMQYLSLATDKMVCNLYDHDIGYHEFMGWAEVELAALPKLSQPSPKQKKKGRAPVDPMAHKHAMWLPLALPPGMETSSYWKKYVSFEGDVPVTGEIQITMWTGSRNDKDMKYAQPAKRAYHVSSSDIKEDDVCCFAETQYGVLCVEVERGEDLLACDDGGVSDPYFKVKYAEGTTFEQSMRTKYIAQTVTPQWNEEMAILVAYPFTNDPKVSVWDYDSTFDDLIGFCPLKFSELAEAKGPKIAKTIKKDWFTLVDNAGATENSEGETYGKVLLRPYIDMEYFQHPEGAMFHEPMGRLEVDILNARELKAYGNYYVVAKLDGLLCRTNYINQKTKQCPPDGLAWNKRLSFPVHETGSVLVVGLFNASNSHELVGKVRVRVSALRGNQRYEKAVQLFQVVSDKVNHSGVLDIAITFKHPTVLGVGVGVLQRYTLSNIPDKHFWKPLPPLELTKMNAKKVTHTAELLDSLYPQLPAKVAKDMYDAKDAEFAIRVMKSSIVRAQTCIDYLDKAGKAFAYLESWQNSCASMFAIGMVCFFMISPQFIIPAMMLGIITKCVMAYPSSFDKQFDYIGMDELLSMGEPPDKDNDHEEEKAAAGDPDAGDSTSFNPLANLQKQYDEMLAMASMVQLKLAEAAGVAEGVVNILDWADPRATTLIIVGCVCALITLYFVELNVFRIKCGMAFGFAYVMRPPFMRDPTPGPPDVWITRAPTLKDRIFT